jgi:4-amino-4-deoxy-L-arabinose transferase-like glycosyltransferase
MPNTRQQIIAAAIAILIVARLVVAGLLPLSADEAYYWLWSKHLAAGYYDHPPAIAWCIRLGTSLFGNTPLGIRFVSILLSVPASWCVWKSAENLLESGEAGATAALYFNLTLMVAVEMLAATPDGPAAAASALFLYALVRVSDSSNGKWWLLAGLAAGLGLLSKYTFFFLGVGSVAWLIASPTARIWLRSPWPYAGAALGFAIFLPNVIWNAQHGWISFAFQFGRVGSGPLTARFLGEFLASQFLLATPFIFVLGVVGFVRSVSNDRLSLLAAIVGTASVYFVLHALHDRVQGNWTSFLFPAIAILAASAPNFAWSSSLDKIVRFSVRGALPLAASMLAIAYAQALFGIVPLGRADPLSRLLAVGMDGVVREIGDARAKYGAYAVVTTDYETAAWLTYYLPPSTPVLALGEDYRWTMMPAPPPKLLALPALYTAEQKADRHAILDAYYSEVIPAGAALRFHGAALVARYPLYRVSVPRPGIRAYSLR